MNYFSRRNNHIVEYSGYEEVSKALRQRLLEVGRKYVGQNVTFDGGDPWWVERKDLLYEVRKEFPDSDPFALIDSGEFHQVFTVVEIFLNLVIKTSRVESAYLDIFQALELSGSVYTVNDFRIELRVGEDLAKKLEEVKPVLSENQSAYERFFSAVGAFFGRREKVEDVVKDIFVAFEDYLKEKTHAKDFGNAIHRLLKNKLISPTQKSLLEKVYAYRSDTKGVGHAGNADNPQEIDALWFVETVTPQILLIDRKLKQNTKS